MSQYRVDIPEKLYEEFKKIAEVEGTSPDQKICELVRQHLMYYRNYNGEINPREAYLYENRNEVKQIAWKNEGHTEPLPDTKVPCWYLGDTFIYGQPYVKIIKDGQLMKVPASHVELKKN